eukprot:CAMPEP_0184692046 /NCGR_PEP_ID=MMETSP0313-20130426/682_1 /TAXON_ID=2792 /ORGANISM="Porphyridium aerugineum, Strain SAG 1380-2" /LENGTH=463 /DNA_ID=CAMNT_0027149845 /DNA_START=66 /DNA_END=1460 /DNA_ORIENTATION=-
MDSKHTPAFGFSAGLVIPGSLSTASISSSCSYAQTQHAVARKNAVLKMNAADAGVSDAPPIVDKRKARRDIMASDRFNRRGFKTTKEEVEGMMTEEFTSSLIAELRQQAYTVMRGNVTVKLAKAYGFCWGVERAIAIAYETRQQFPTETLWLTNEVIHNPIVNKRLADMGIKFVPQEGLTKDLTVVEDGDVVILPAFGATLEEMQYLTSRGVQIVDTTCPWVSKVWNALDKHQKANCTSVIHGKWKHEETIATASFAEKYLIVLNLAEAEYVCNYIMNGGNKAEFVAKFKNAMSQGFDPDRDLQAVGIANQTTMLKGETEEIGKLFEKTMMKKYGVENLGAHFVSMNTICDATQERQDAMYDLIKEDELDMMLVVGGFNSSNTSHLQEISEHANITSYWVDSPACIGPGNRIRYCTADHKEHIKDNFLPIGKKVTIGVTSGASTPDKVVEDVLERIFMISKLG